MKLLPTAMVALVASSYGFAETPALFHPHESILFQGDSITDGNRGRNADPNHILGHGYAFLIAARYGAAFPAYDLQFANRGISGNRVQDLVDRWDTDTIALKPDVLSILIGINDINEAFVQGKPFDAAAVGARYDALLERTNAALPGVKLILCEPFTLEVGVVAKHPDFWRQAVHDMDAEVARLGAKYHAPVVHLQQTFQDALKRAPATHWIWDGIHPTYAGHQLLADAWQQAYNAAYVSPLLDPERNSAIHPEVNFERDSYDWLHRHADILDEQAKSNPDVVMIGDSITHFWSGEPRDNRRNGPNAWTATFGSLKVVNMGMGWDRTQNVLWRLKKGEFKGITPKTIILNIGTNNLVGDETARTNTPEEVAVGIEAIVNELQARSPHSRIVVMAVFPRGFEKGNALDKQITVLDGILAKSLAAYPQVTFLNIGDQLRDANGAITPKIMSDGTHPTEAGYAIWGKALRDAGVLP